MPSTHQAQPIQLFVSTVTDEFGSYRDRLAADLDLPHVSVKRQERFIATGKGTLDKLAFYIRFCDAVIHVAGEMTGATPHHSELAELPADVLDRLPSVKDALAAGVEVSYTQWEAYLAIYYGKRLFVCIPESTAERDVSSADEPAQASAQAAHLQRIEALGRFDRIHFVNAEGLAFKVLASLSSVFLESNSIPLPPPRSLPHPSVGTRDVSGKSQPRTDAADELLEAPSDTLLRYLQWARSWPDRNRKAYLAGRLLSDVFLPPELEAVSEGTDGGRDLGERTEPRRRSWNEVWRASSFVVVEGEPGAGKSTLLIMTAREIAEQALEAIAGGGALQEALLPVLLPLKLVAEQRSLENALRQLLTSPLPSGGGFSHEEAGELSRTLLPRLQNSGAVLLLDALDEAPRPQDLQDALSGLWSAPGLQADPGGEPWPHLHVILTSRPGVDLHREVALPPYIVPQHWRLTPLTREWRTQFLTQWTEQSPLRADPDVGAPFERLKELILGHAPFSGVKDNALRLTIAFAVMEQREVGVGATRGELYRALLEDLLTGVWQSDRARADDRYTRDCLALLPEVAWLLYRSDPRQKSFPEAQIRKVLREVTGDGLTHISERIVFLERRGLLVRTSGNSLEFLHHSFLDLLVAQWLQEQLTSAHPQEPTGRVTDVLDDMAWLGNSEEALLQLAGLLDHRELVAVTQLIRRPRVTEGHDDQARHRLSLAGRFLAEASPAVRQHRTVLGLVEEVTLELWRFCRDHHADPAYGHSAAGLTALGRANAPLGGVPLLTRLVDALAGKDELLGNDALTSATATAVLGRVDQTLPDEALLRLVRLLVEGSHPVREAAQQALIAARTSIQLSTQSALLALLNDAQAEVRRCAAQVLEATPTAALQLEPAGLRKWLDDDRPEVRETAALLLIRMGQGLPLPVLEDLADWLEEGQAKERRAAVRVLARVGATLPETILNQLAAVLKHRSPAVTAAVVVLSAAGAALPKSVVERLFRWVETGPETPRRAAATVLARAGASLGSERLSRLVKLLESGAADERAAATEVLTGCGPLLPLSVLEQVAPLLAGSLGEARQAAARVLGGVGDGLPSQTIAQLTAWLQGESLDAQVGAALALAQSGPELPDTVLPRLTELLDAPCPEVREAVVRLLVDLAGRAPQSVMETLTPILADERWERRRLAARVLMRATAPPPQALAPQLLSLLESGLPGTLEPAARLLARLGSALPDHLAERMLRWLRDGKPDEQQAAVHLISDTRPALPTDPPYARLTPPVQVEAKSLVSLLDDPRTEVRASAAVVLRRAFHPTDLLGLLEAQVDRCAAKGRDDAAQLLLSMYAALPWGCAELGVKERERLRRAVSMLNADAPELRRSASQLIGKLTAGGMRFFGPDWTPRLTAELLSGQWPRRK